MSSSTSTQQTSWLLSIAVVLIYFIPYGIVNHLPIARHTVAFILGEDRIPFLPCTYLVYISVFVQALIVLRRLSVPMLRKLFLGVLALVLIAFVFFIAFPIEYPRALYASDNVFAHLIRFADGPGNCFPSLHVAITVLLSSIYMLLDSSRLRQGLMWLWSGAIMVSVLTTKQHYVIDIAGGIILAIPFCVYIHKGTMLE